MASEFISGKVQCELSYFQGEQGSTGPKGERGIDGLPGSKVNKTHVH